MSDPAPMPRRDHVLLRIAQGFFAVYAFFFLAERFGAGLSDAAGYNTLFWVALWTTASALLVHLFRGGSEGRGFGGWVLFLFLVGMFSSVGLMIRLMVIFSGIGRR